MIRNLGDYGEKIIREAFPNMALRQTPGSGNRWPRKQDLEGPRHLVQVKTTRAGASGFLANWLTLFSNATVEGKKAKWYEVHITANEGEAVIVEKRVVKIVELGLAGMIHDPKIGEDE